MKFVVINENTEEGFQDLTFNITHYWREKGYHVVKAFGQFEGEIVGFMIAFKNNMIRGISTEGEINDNAFHQNGIVFYSLGSDSDYLVNVISHLYLSKDSNSKMNNVVPFTCFTLAGDPSNFENEILKFKLFFDEDEELNRYCELYVNIDLRRKVLELKEKDEEYRENIVMALTLPI
ncbi:hypothetical protein COE15_04300 [Bacillus cereus]|uniref:hypothetical protein n=1 Tax=unclassified Bacillus (in: firmicutes) TaxID=185979 RepID=UPI0006914C1C|nr:MULTISPECIES: hypothetical protein [unclassified Bacillus (in: firmicutes)]PFE05644.1 hypothetical protein CN288_02550 [Bacillus sp. AFS023182]PGY04488.1 hypothetical protein COE15_04300 [Bacillus cereus]